ncbi:hybrid sensor histidine kinase/response regulator [Alteromonas sp. BL110]|uniref:ATP-binding protein n=1 Tax=Alteromonas sp. BL110 TaxID=1714845 RepID=UPI000E4FF8C8|nr:ATP-binding protein [Alteromonas sp. BL110]AXT38117.1 hybrid sensor histidine kinase/response regulator [Alteromonas sp. BL110]RKM80860.1 response regulator [Alteromonas sp. BL110]
MKIGSNSFSISWSLALQILTVCALGAGLNALNSPFDSTGIATFGIGAAVYASLRFSPFISIPIALLISLPLWLNEGSIVGKESLTLLPIVLSFFGYDKSLKQVIKVGAGFWSIVFLPILLLEHSLFDYDNVNMLFSGVLVTWVSGVFGLIIGHFAYLAIYGLKRQTSNKSERVTLHFLFGYFFSGCFFVASMAVIYLSVSLFQLQQEQQIHSYMSQRVKVLEFQLSNFLRQHQNAITTTAAILSNNYLEKNLENAAAKNLQIVSSHNPEFLTFLVANADGDITHAYPPDMLEKAKQNGRPNVSYRPYFYEVIRSGEPFLSNVFQGRGFGNDPIVALSAPILDSEGSPKGIVEGSLSLKSFHAIDSLSLDGFSMLIEDQKGEVIYASDALALKPLTKAPFYSCEPKCVNEVENGPLGKTWLRFTENISFANWKVSYYFDKRLLMASMSSYLLKDLLLLLALSAFGTFTGYVVAKMVGAPIRRLIRYIADFEPTQKKGKKAPQRALHIQELSSLSDEFMRLETRLLGAFDELKKAREIEQGLNVELNELNLSLEKRIEEKTEHLALALKEAEAANVAKTQFLANMSHEIRTPMNGIVGSCELMLDNELPEHIAVRAKTISRSATNLLIILDSILDWSKIEAGKMLCDIQRCDIRELLIASCELYRHTAQVKGYDIALNISSHVPDSLNIDAGKVAQVINNLLSNAIKFTNEGEVAVDVSYAHQELKVSIKDSGIGIAPDKMHLIFEKFEQADTSTTRHFGGTGLGLAISKGLIELLGGELYVESELDKGTNFTFHIPADMSNSDMQVQRQAPATLPNGLRVLLAEDNDINADIVMDMLKSANIKCIRTKNGRDAVQAEKKHDFDLVLMDCQMPIMDGLAASTLIRKEGRNKTKIKIIALTANAFIEDKNACLEAGMNAHLGKPIRKQVLFDCIARELASV